MAGITTRQCCKGKGIKVGHICPVKYFILQKFLNVGISLNIGFTSFKIDESDARWNDIQVLIEEYEAVDTASTKFSDKEMRSANFLRLVGGWHSRYPELSRTGALETGLFESKEPFSNREQSPENYGLVELFRTLRE